MGAPPASTRLDPGCRCGGTGEGFSAPRRPPTSPRCRLHPGQVGHLACAAAPDHHEHHRYGITQNRSWDRLHPRLTHRSSWLAHAGRLPIIEGTLIRWQVEHLPGEGEAKPVWLGVPPAHGRRDVADRVEREAGRSALADVPAPLRLGAHLPDAQADAGLVETENPNAGDRRTWLVIAAHTRLRLARGLVEDRRRPWQPRARAGRLTPARVRWGFADLHSHLGQPAGAPKPSWPGPGRPPGAKNRQRAPRYDVGWRTPRPSSLTALRDQAG